MAEPKDAGAGSNTTEQATMVAHAVGTAMHIDVTAPMNDVVPQASPTTPPAKAAPENDDLGTPVGGGDGEFAASADFASHRFIGPSVVGDDASVRRLHGIRRVNVHSKPPRFESEAVTVVEARRKSSGVSVDDGKGGVRSLSAADQALNSFSVTFTEPSLGFKTDVVVNDKNELVVNVASVDRESPAHRAGVVRKKAVVHHNIFCDGCGMDPIQGALWTCSVCSNYNLCHECYDLGTHGMENTDAMQLLSEAIVQDKLQKKCKQFTAEFMLSLRRDICKGRTDKVEYMGGWIADIVIGTAASKISVRGIEIPSLTPVARQRFVALLMPLVSNRTDIEVNIEWVPDDSERASVDIEDAIAAAAEADEELEKLRIWISDKKTRTTSPFATSEVSDFGRKHQSLLSALAIKSATNGACLSKPTHALAVSGARMLSTEADATAEFLEATAPTEFRSVKTVKRDVRISGQKLSLIARQVRGLPATDALLQMQFSPKRKAEIVKKTLQNAVNLADIKYNIEPENLQVAECFVTKGTYLKRLRIMGRGRSGIMHHPYSHLTVVLREFDPSKKPLNRFLTKKRAREAAHKPKHSATTMAWSDELGPLIRTKSGLKPTDEHLAGKKVVGLYFSAHWCPPCRGFTPFLSATYDDMIESHPDFELIFVSSDRDSASFEEYYKEMPFAALPFDDRERKEVLGRKYNVMGIPFLLFLNEKGEVITVDGRMIVAEARGDVDKIWNQLTSNVHVMPGCSLTCGFASPRSSQSPRADAMTFWTELVGEQLLTNNGLVPTDEHFKDKKVVGLYASAHWCPPCRAFTPLLSTVYDDLVEEHSDIEIVFLSFDRQVDQFNVYYGEMPFAAVPYEDRQRQIDLTEKYNIFGVPILMFFDDQGRCLTVDGQQLVEDCNGDVSKLHHQLTSGEELPRGDVAEYMDKLEERNKGKFPVVSSWPALLGEQLLTKSDPQATASQLSDKSVIGLYVSVSSEPGCKDFTPKLNAMYERLIKANRSVEIVLVELAEDEESLDKIRSEFEFPALPHPSDNAKDKIFENYGVEEMPSLYWFNSKGEVICHDGVQLIHLPMLHHWPTLTCGVACHRTSQAHQLRSDTTMTFWTELVGEQVLTKNGLVPTAEHFKYKKVVGLYASAHWCPPCREFTPILSTVYEDLVEEHSDIEIVFLSSDEEADQFSEYYEEMPFVAVPYEDRQRQTDLTEKYNIFAVPILMFFDDQGKLLTVDGGKLVEDCKGDIAKLHHQLTSGEELPRGDVAEYMDTLEQRKKGIYPVASSWETLFGENLLTKSGLQTTASLLSEKIVVGLYMSVSSEKECKEFTPKLTAAYEGLVKNNCDVAIVLLEMTEDEESFNKICSEFPFPAMRFSSEQEQEKIFNDYGCDDMPTLFWFNNKGEMICPTGVQLVQDADGDVEKLWQDLTTKKIVPDKQATSHTMSVWTQFFGEHIQTKDGLKPTAEHFKDKSIVAIYFSAHWCPPCRGFTPVLSTFYEDLIEEHPDAEVVFVSADRDSASFGAYFKEMPFVALPFEQRNLKSALSAKYGVSSIPTVLFLNAKGELITRQGRELVARSNGDTEQVWGLLTSAKGAHFIIAIPAHTTTSTQASKQATNQPTSHTMSVWTQFFGEHIQTKDGLKPTAEHFKDKSIVGIYFSAHWCPPCRGFTPVLSTFYEDLIEEHPDAEVVFVSADRDSASFGAYFKEMPFVALPFEARNQESTLSYRYDVSSIPTLLFLNAKGELITREGRGLVASSNGNTERVWQELTSANKEHIMSVWTQFFGEHIQTKDGLKPTAEHFKDKSIVGIYFSAHWCPPCRGFTPFLSTVYEDLLEEHPDVEVVFVSADRDSASFGAYFKGMPFVALPFEARNLKSALSAKYEVSGIPMLLFLNAKGELITRDGRELVAGSNGDIDQIWQQLH
ncbi:TPA: hypothetical protein N0F65_001981 [Lagenidium giganteum]|uniref:Nucleoredoxin n=1 Tax=Lagenidium giganteum TaxID=4803 RepID=A0AAV2YZ51_9STRA|nr:TPA: hypothetical protein N0F65_001981 [Lagenidium giganteum]